MFLCDCKGLSIIENLSDKYRVLYITPEYIENNFETFEMLNKKNG